MTADFRFIAHAAKRHTNVFPSGRFGDGLTQRGFTYPGGPTRQRIGPLILFTRLCTARYSRMRSFTRPAIVIGIEDLLGLTQVFLTLLRAFHGTCTIQSM